MKKESDLTAKYGDEQGSSQNVDFTNYSFTYLKG